MRVVVRPQLLGYPAVRRQEFQPDTGKAKPKPFEEIKGPEEQEETPPSPILKELFTAGTLDGFIEAGKVAPLFEEPEPSGPTYSYVNPLWRLQEALRPKGWKECKKTLGNTIFCREKERIWLGTAGQYVKEGDKVVIKPTGTYGATYGSSTPEKPYYPPPNAKVSPAFHSLDEVVDWIILNVA